MHLLYTSHVTLQFLSFDWFSGDNRKKSTCLARVARNSLATDKPVALEFPIEVFFFVWRKEKQSTRRKTLGARTRTNNKLNPHMTLGPGIKTQPARVLSTALSMLLADIWYMRELIHHGPQICKVYASARTAMASKYCNPFCVLNNTIIPQPFHIQGPLMEKLLSISVWIFNREFSTTFKYSSIERKLITLLYSLSGQKDKFSAFLSNHQLYNYFFRVFITRSVRVI